MLHGLLWLPLLVVFFVLAGLGWHEWQKLQAYQVWAQDFDQAKYDIRAVLGLKRNQLTWGKPTRQQPKNLQTLSLESVQEIQVWVDQQPIALTHPPTQAHQIDLVLISPSLSDPVHIPFTDVTLAVRWAEYLQRQIQDLSLTGQGTPTPPPAS